MDVTVQTGDGWLGLDGTHSFLYLELIGENGKRSRESNVAKGGHYKDFQSGKTDHYVVAFKDVGPIRQLKVRLQENPSGGFFGGWTFEKITINNGDKTYTFGGQDVDSDGTVTVNAFVN
ncbi:Lipoxygenase y domain-containing protein 1 [Desmophyllum pertusum]|uniref:Lipoxygenase y domain-containing protein 1 n=1 Tax=Desmophyllum pertusum TaxID=174260 RepID=A0A9W9YX21_9CNID|nr:Lipoxygenase y domain-containing protein 1 [Desmophyllum pertusum]